MNHKGFLQGALMGCVLLLTLGAGLADASIIYAHRFQQGDLVRFDTSTTTETIVGATGQLSAFGFSFRNDGTLFGINQNANLYTIDINSGAATLVGNTGLNGVEALTFDLSGNLFAASSGASGLHQINTSTGAATPVGPITGIPDVDGLSVAPVAVTIAGFGVAAAGDFLAVDTGTLYHINPSTLVATNLGSTQGSETLAFAPDGSLFVHDFGGSLYSRNLSTGAETFVMSTSGSIASMALQQGAVPEPGSIGLLGLGLAALVWGSRRKAR